MAETQYGTIAQTQSSDLEVTKWIPIVNGTNPDGSPIITGYQREEIVNGVTTIQYKDANFVDTATAPTGLPTPTIDSEIESETICLQLKTDEDVKISKTTRRAYVNNELKATNIEYRDSDDNIITVPDQTLYELCKPSKKCCERCDIPVHYKKIANAGEVITIKAGFQDFTFNSPDDANFVFVDKDASNNDRTWTKTHYKFLGGMPQVINENGVNQEQTYVVTSGTIYVDVVVTRCSDETDPAIDDVITIESSLTLTKILTAGYYNPDSNLFIVYKNAMEDATFTYDMLSGQVGIPSPTVRNIFYRISQLDVSGVSHPVPTAETSAIPLNSGTISSMATILNSIIPSGANIEFDGGTHTFVSPPLGLGGSPPALGTNIGGIKFDATQDATIQIEIGVDDQSGNPLWLGAVDPDTYYTINWNATTGVVTFMGETSPSTSLGLEDI